MPRRKDASPLSSVVTAVLQNLQSQKKPMEELRLLWGRLAGREAARHSWPRRLAQGRLIVEVENSGWMHELGARRQELLEDLTEWMGAWKVRELQFRIGERRDA